MKKNTLIMIKELHLKNQNNWLKYLIGKMSDTNLNVDQLYIPESVNELKLEGTNDIKIYGNVLSQTEGETR